MKTIYSFSLLWLILILQISCLSISYADDNVKAVSLKYLVYNDVTKKFDNEINKDGFEIFLQNKDSVKIKPVAVFQNVSISEYQFYVGFSISNNALQKQVYYQELVITGSALQNPSTSGIIYVDANGQLAISGWYS